MLSADGDVAALAEGIAARRTEIGGVVLHPGAAELAGDLAGALERAKVEVRPLTLYETIAVKPSPHEMAHLPEMDVALVHSAKAAKALASVLKVQPLPHLRVLTLSKAVMKPLARAQVAAKVFAPFLSKRRC